MKAQNIPEFKALIERYETITLREIFEAYQKYFDPQENLTGFGSTETCPLCKKFSNDDGLTDCSKCVYGKGIDNFNVNCMSGILEESYTLIINADSPEQLLDAYRNRAKVLRKYAKNKNIKL